LIGVVPDESNLYPELSGFDNLCFCAALYGMGKKEALAHTGKFSLTRQAQRLLFDDELLLDIIPFGGVAEDNFSISWPKDAADLFFILKNYIDAGNMDRFFEEADILKEVFWIRCPITHSYFQPQKICAALASPPGKSGLI
jgi:predicted nucleotidyltransferase